MIIDQLGVFFDDTAVAASMTSEVIPFMPWAGREDPVYITLLAKGETTDALTFSIQFQQSEDSTTFETVATYEMKKPSADPVIKALRLPLMTKYKYARMLVTVTGTVAGTLFAGVTRDHFAPYEEGLYIDAGEVIA